MQQQHHVLLPDITLVSAMRILIYLAQRQPYSHLYIFKWACPYHHSLHVPMHMFHNGFTNHIYRVWQQKCLGMSYVTQFYHCIQWLPLPQIPLFFPHSSLSNLDCKVTLHTFESTHMMKGSFDLQWILGNSLLSDQHWKHWSLASIPSKNWSWRFLANTTFGIMFLIYSRKSPQIKLLPQTAIRREQK